MVHPQTNSNPFTHAHMSAFKVRLTPLTPISAFHPEPPLPVESKREIIPAAALTDRQTPSLPAFDWRFDELASSQFLPEELNMMFPSDFPVLGSFTAQPAHSGPDFESVNYDTLVGAFCVDEHPLSWALPQELEAELWELTQGMEKPLFEKCQFFSEAQEDRFVESGFEEFAAFGMDFDGPPQVPLEGSSEDGHSR